MIEATINFIISLIGIFVKFLSSIEINLFGYTFSFYSFILASILIFVFVGGLIIVTRKAGGLFLSSVDKTFSHASSAEADYQKTIPERKRRDKERKKRKKRG